MSTCSEALSACVRACACVLMHHARLICLQDLSMDGRCAVEVFFQRKVRDSQNDSLVDFYSRE